MSPLPDIPEDLWIQDQQEKFDQGAQDLEDGTAFQVGTYGTVPDIGRYAPAFEPPVKDDYKKTGSGEFQDVNPFILGPDGPTPAQAQDVPNTGTQYPEQILNPDQIDNGYTVANVPPISSASEFDKFSNGLIDNIKNLAQPPTAQAAELETSEQTAQRHQAAYDAQLQNPEVNPDQGPHELPANLSPTEMPPTPENTAVGNPVLNAQHLAEQTDWGKVADAAAIGNPITNAARNAQHLIEDQTAPKPLGPDIPLSDPRLTGDEQIRAQGFDPKDPRAYDPFSRSGRTNIQNKFLNDPGIGFAIDAITADQEVVMRQNPEIYGNVEDRHAGRVEDRLPILAILEPLTPDRRVQVIATLKENGIIPPDADVPLQFDKSVYYTPIKAAQMGFTSQQLLDMLKSPNPDAALYTALGKLSPEERDAGVQAIEQRNAANPNVENTEMPFTPFSQDPVKSARERQQYSEAISPKESRESLHTSAGIAEGAASGVFGGITAAENLPGIVRGAARVGEALVDPIQGAGRVAGDIRTGVQAIRDSRFGEAVGQARQSLDALSDPAAKVIPSEIASQLPTDPYAAKALPEIMSRIADGTNADIGLKSVEPLEDGKVAVQLNRFQSPEQHTLDSDLRGGVFYSPYGNTAYKETDNVPLSAMRTGGDEAVSGRTIFNNPVVVPDPSEGNSFTGLEFIRQQKGDKYAEDLSTDAYRLHAQVTAPGVSEESKLNKVRIFLSQWEGYPARAESLLKAAIDDKSTDAFRVDNHQAVIENIATAQAQTAGYDGIIGYAQERNKAPKISEIIDLRESKYPGPNPDQFEVKNSYLPENLRSTEGRTTVGSEVLDRAGLKSENIDQTPPQPLNPSYQTGSEADFKALGNSAPISFTHADPSNSDIENILGRELTNTAGPEAASNFQATIAGIKEGGVVPSINEVKNAYYAADPEAKAKDAPALLNQYGYKLQSTVPNNQLIVSNVQSVFAGKLSDQNNLLTDRRLARGLVSGAGEYNREENDNNTEPPNPFTVGGAIILGAMGESAAGKLLNKRTRTVGHVILNAMDQANQRDMGLATGEHLRGLGNIQAETEGAQKVIEDVQKVIRGQLDDLPVEHWQPMVDKLAHDTGEPVSAIKQKWFDQFGKPNAEAERGFIYQAAMETNAERIAEMERLQAVGLAPIDVLDQLDHLNGVQGILQFDFSQRNQELARAMNALKIGHAQSDSVAALSSLDFIKSQANDLKAEIVKSSAAGMPTDAMQSRLDNLELFWLKEKNRPNSPYKGMSVEDATGVKGASATFDPAGYDSSVTGSQGVQASGATPQRPTSGPGSKGPQTPDARDNEQLQTWARQYAAYDDQLKEALRTQNTSEADQIRAEQQHLAQQMDSILLPRQQLANEAVKDPLTQEAYDKLRGQKVLQERRKLIKNALEEPAKTASQMQTSTAKMFDETYAQDRLDAIQRLRNASGGSTEWRKYANDMLTDLGQMGGYIDVMANKYKQRTSLADFKKIVGADTKITPEMSVGLNRLDFSDGRAVANYVKVLMNSTDPALHVEGQTQGWGQKLATMRLASLLSGMALVKNFTGNEINRAGMVGELAVEATKDVITTAGGLLGPRGTQYEDVAAMVRGYLGGFSGALNEAKETWRTGNSARNVRESTVRTTDQGLPLGLNSVLKGLAASDDYSWCLNMNMALETEATREARLHGVAVSEIRDHMGDYPQVLERASEKASRANLADNLDGTAQALNRLRSNNPVVKFLIPFYNTSASIARQGVAELSPYGWIKARQYRQQGDIFRASDMDTRAAIGTTLFGLGGFGGANGTIRIYGPDNREQQNMQRTEENAQDLSINIGGHNISLLTLGPYAVPIVLGAIVGEAYRNENTPVEVQKDNLQRALNGGSHVVVGTATSLANLTGLQGIINALKIVGSSPAQATGEVIQQTTDTVVSSLPYGGLLGVLRRGIDRSARDTSSGIEYIINNMNKAQGSTDSYVEPSSLTLLDKAGSTVINRLPGVSRLLPESLSPTGEGHPIVDPAIRAGDVPIVGRFVPQSAANVPVGINPLDTLPAKQDSLYDTLMSKGIALGDAPTSVAHPNMKGVQLDLTKNEQQEYQRIFGERFRHAAQLNIEKYGDDISPKNWDDIKTKAREYANKQIIDSMNDKDFATRAKQAYDKLKKEQEL